MSIVNKALIVCLRISQWTGRKLDRTATGTVETAFATHGHVGNYNKRLLPGAEALDRVGRVAGSMRQFFYTQTLPWCNDGARMLAAQNYIPFTAEYREKKIEFQAAVDAFLLEYPALKEASRAKLGSLFNEAEYPSTLRLESAFRCEVSFMPVPDVGDFRVEILDSEKETFLKTMRDAESEAMRECWKRLYDVAYKAATKLSEPGAIFRDSLIENISETCALLPRLNISDSPDLEAARRNLETLAAGIQPETMRASELARNDAAQKLAEITARMGSFMGGAK